MKTNVSIARQLLQQHLPSLQTAQEFKQWIYLRLVRDMGGQDLRAEFYESAQFEQTYQVFQDTTFHVVEGRHSWETNLLDYFRRKVTDAQWLEDLYHLFQRSEQSNQLYERSETQCQDFNQKWPPATFPPLRKWSI
jgi:hypothetical protein